MKFDVATLASYTGRKLVLRKKRNKIPLIYVIDTPEAANSGNYQRKWMMKSSKSQNQKRVKIFVNTGFPS